MVNPVQGYEGWMPTINYSIRRNNSDMCDTVLSEIDKILPSVTGGSNISSGLIIRCTETVRSDENLQPSLF